MFLLCLFVTGGPYPTMHCNMSHPPKNSGTPRELQSSGTPPKNFRSRDPPPPKNFSTIEDPPPLYHTTILQHYREPPPPTLYHTTIHITKLQQYRGPPHYTTPLYFSTMEDPPPTIPHHYTHHYTSAL